MLGGPVWLALEVKYLDPAVAFYREHLALPVERRTDTEATLAAGDTRLVLRAPSTVPRGGLHTHYAFSAPAAAYDDWWDALAPRFDLDEYTFGSARSCYFYDTEGNCVEIGGRDPGTERTVTGIFEVVFEVEDLARAERFWRALGFDVMDRGADRARLRLTCGDFDVELWEPHLGLADARGGVHVDIGIACDEPQRVADRVGDDALAVERVPDGLRLRDPDGHYVTLVDSE